MKNTHDCETETVGPVRAVGVGAALMLVYTDLVKESL